MLVSLDCLPLVNVLTRTSNISSTLIDQIYTNNILHNNTTHTFVIDFSDYLPVFTLLHSFKKTAKNKCSIHIRDTKNFNSKNFSTALAETLSNLSCKEGSVNNHFNNCISKFKNVINVYASLRKQTKKKKIISN